MQKSAILQDLMDSTEGLETSMVESLADIVRSKVSQMAAKKLVQVIQWNSITKEEAQILKQQAKLLFHVHKTKLIMMACDTIKYIHYGEEQEICDYKWETQGISLWQELQTYSPYVRELILHIKWGSDVVVHYNILNSPLYNFYLIYDMVKR